MTSTHGRGTPRGILPQSIRDHFAREYFRPTGGIFSEFSRMLSDGNLTTSKRHRLLKKLGAEDIVGYRKGEIDLVLSYLVAAVESQTFSAEKRRDFTLLKELFEIVEGEFAQYRPMELASMLNAELERILEDDVIDPKEDEYQVALQEALGLGYDQYMGFCRVAFEHAALKLEQELTSASDGENRRRLQRKIGDLPPLIRLAQMQHRTPGALY